MELTRNQKIISQLFEKSWADPAFKQKLVADPEQAIREATGSALDLPEGKTLVVVDQTDTEKVYLNIPPELDMEEIELTDEQLELIAGGAKPSDAVASTVKNP
ncbi:MAG: NHLP leader peptide family RiPP precursor [Bacteroidota bacterium]